MDLLQLRYFQVVARLEHMTKAAEELFIAQPSLSKTIRRLEREMGVPLFERQGRVIRLNTFGKTFLAHVETMFRELEEGQRKVRDMAGLEHGEVSLSATTVFWLPDLLHRFQTRYPSVRFHLSQCELAEMAHRLETGVCDFCFVPAPLPSRGLQWKLLRTEEILLVVPPTHRLAGQEGVPLSEVARETIVIERVGTGLRDQMESCCRQAGFTLRPSYEIDEPAALFAFVQAQLGVGFTTALMKKRVHEYGLTTLHLTPACQRAYGAAWHQEHYLSQAARAFHHFLMEEEAQRE
ncbi:LysR family transcriptional regulator [Reticulibacter mediterranei]|uniref:LysR family transcriptional regulator n=1 Tax=Reticulibacter mediterranei TaxID=2778369 RepID=A0A8J3IWN1_9CHLR|nr:LysR substrate-binding domain-containing protein [Reticulibacter mediterranei]GHO98190.1 LysR family transcriptional regulator [Reticulibacter mediterranei]